MTGVEAIGVVLAFIYGGGTIGLLCSIKYDLGGLKQQQTDHDRRINKLEFKLS